MVILISSSYCNLCKAVIHHPTLLNSTDHFSDNSTAGAVATEVVSWVELSWVGSNSVITLKTQLYLTKNRQFLVSREVLYMFRTSQLTADWQLFCRVELSWVFRVITLADLTQLKSPGQLSDHSAWCQLSWVESAQVMWSRLKLTIAVYMLFVGCTFSGSSAAVLRHKITCEHSNLQLDTNSQQVLFTCYSLLFKRNI